MGATEFAPKIRKRYQTNELVVDSTEFGTRGSEVQILSPPARPEIASMKTFVPTKGDPNLVPLSTVYFL